MNYIEKELNLNEIILPSVFKINSCGGFYLIKNWLKDNSCQTKSYSEIGRDKLLSLRQKDTVIFFLRGLSKGDFNKVHELYDFIFDYDNLGNFPKYFNFNKIEKQTIKGMIYFYYIIRKNNILKKVNN